MVGDIAKLFLDLGISGAALFIVYYLINKIFDYLSNRSQNDNQIDKLCDKIDRMVDAINVSTGEATRLGALNTQMQGIIKGEIDTQATITNNIFTKVESIDFRTRRCLDKQ